LVADAYKEGKKVWGDDILQQPASRREQNAFEAYNDLSDGSDDDDELQRYLTAPCVKRHVDGRPYPPLEWWVNHCKEFPVLSHIAFELLAAPSSTATTKRLFSIAGNVVNESRPMTQAHLAESV